MCSRARAVIIRGGFTVALVLLPRCAALGLDASQWTHRVAVQATSAAGKGVVRCELTEQVLARARTGLADLRLVDGRGRVVPYVLREQRGRRRRVAPYPARRLFNRAFVPGKQACVIADFGDRRMRNALEITTPGNNFRRRVLVEGSRDGERFDLLTRSAWIFAVPGPPVQRAARVALGENDYRYYRVTVFRGPDDPQRLQVTGVLAGHVEEIEAQLREAPISSTRVIHNDKQGWTEIHLDLGYENLLLHDVTLDFEDADFSRACELRGRNRKVRTVLQRVEDAQPRPVEVPEPWSLVGHGVICRVSTGKERFERLRLPGSGRLRYLAVRVYNRDDPPLAFRAAKVRRIRQDILFRARDIQGGDGGALWLLMGNRKASAPSYDLGTYLRRLETGGGATAQLGQVTENPAFHPPRAVVPWSERHAWLLTVAMILLVALIGGLVLQQSRRLPADGGGNGE